VGYILSCVVVASFLGRGGVIMTCYVTILRCDNQNVYNCCTKTNSSQQESITGGYKSLWLGVWGRGLEVLNRQVTNPFLICDKLTSPFLIRDNLTSPFIICDKGQENLVTSDKCHFLSSTGDTGLLQVLVTRANLF
jgi:hypothetical protein